MSHPLGRICHTRAIDTASRNKTTSFAWPPVQRLVSSCLGADGQDSWGNFAIRGVSSCPAGTVTTAGVVCLWKSIHISPRTSNTDVSLCSETRTFKRPALVGFSQLPFPNLLVATQSEQPAAASTDGVGWGGG